MKICRLRNLEVLIGCLGPVSGFRISWHHPAIGVRDSRTTFRKESIRRRYEPIPPETGTRNQAAAPGYGTNLYTFPSGIVER